MERVDDPLVVDLAAVTNKRFGENSLAQVALPIRLEGLGTRMAKDITLPAFISSLLAVPTLVDGVLNNILLLESNDLSTMERD